MINKEDEAYGEDLVIVPLSHCRDSSSISWSSFAGISFPTASACLRKNCPAWMYGWMNIKFSNLLQDYRELFFTNYAGIYFTRCTTLSKHTSMTVFNNRCGLTKHATEIFLCACSSYMAFEYLIISCLFLWSEEQSNSHLLSLAPTEF